MSSVLIGCVLEETIRMFVLNKFKRLNVDLRRSKADFQGPQVADPMRLHGDS